MAPAYFIMYFGLLLNTLVDAICLAAAYTLAFIQQTLQNLTHISPYILFLLFFHSVVHT